MSDYTISREAVDQLKAMADKVDGLADVLRTVRTPSMAGVIGSKAAAGTYGAPSKAGLRYQPDIEAGAFLEAVARARGNDAELQALGKATLDEMAVAYEDSWGKAALGNTDATGGWIIPNALVDDLLKPNPAASQIADLVTTISGVNANAVDVPFRSAAPARATVIAFGQTKENLDLTYNGYTATMYTLARIHDIGNQFLRQSRGAAEQDVLSELAEALRLGFDYYLINGTGSSQPFGLISALSTGPATFTTSHSPATTLAGSVIVAIGKTLGDLAARGVVSGLTAVMSPTSYVNLVTQGADTAGVYFAGTQGAQSIPGFQAGTPVVFGVPCIADNYMPTDDLIVGQFRKLKAYTSSMRIDSSDQAGSRWDTNLTGFRGELELGADARPAVYSGYFQYVSDIVP